MINLAFHQKGLGHEVWIGCGLGRSLEQFARQRGLQVLSGLFLRSRLNPLEIFPDIRRLRHIIRTINPHVIHCHLLHDHWLAALAIRGMDENPFLFRTMHRYLKPYPDPLHRRLFFKCTDVLIVPSHAMKKLILTKYPAYSDHITTIHGGVNLERFHPELSGRRIREEMDIPEEAPVAGIVSRIRKDRGFNWLLKALPIVLERLPHARIMIVGKGEMSGEIRQRIQSPPYRGRVKMAGYRSHNLPQTYSAMDVSLFLAFGSEGGCRAIMESMATATPVIGMRCGPVPEIIGDESTGLTVPQNDSVLLADGLCELLSDLPRTRSMGIRARRRMVEKFSLQDKALRTIELYHKVMRKDQ